MVFHFAVAAPNGNWVRRTPTAHVGIAAEDVEAHALSQPVLVYHMARSYVARDLWASGSGDDSRVDACGVMPDIDDLLRDDVVNHALEIYGRTSLLDASDSCWGYYWLGSPSPASHPAYPNREDAYAFSCATFSHECYRLAAMPVVDCDSMPPVDERTWRLLRRKLVGHVPDAPFPLLYPSYLMWAFHLDEYPFSTDDWVSYQDHGVFLPTASLT